MTGFAWVAAGFLLAGLLIWVGYMIGRTDGRNGR